MGLYMGSNAVAALHLAGTVSAVHYGSEKVWPESDPAEMWIYQTSDDGVMLLRYLGTERYVAVPDTIEGLPVTAIAPTACNYSNVTLVSIPASVVSVL